MGIIDFIFPKRCVLCKKQGSYLCSNCFSYLSFDTTSICLICNNYSSSGLTHSTCNKNYSIDGSFSALSNNKTMQKLIYSFKHKPFLSDLKSLLSELFYESIIQNENFVRQLEKGKWIFIPIPLSSSRLRQRGYNQSELLSKEISKKFNLPLVLALKRIKDTRIKDAFLIKPEFNNLIFGKNIFLVDDVVVKGHTLNEAAKILKTNGAKSVIGLTLARS